MHFPKSLIAAFVATTALAAPGINTDGEVSRIRLPEGKPPNIPRKTNSLFEPGLERRVKSSRTIFLHLFVWTCYLSASLITRSYLVKCDSDMR